MAVMIAHVRDVVTPPSQLRPEVPADLERVVLRCLAKDQHDRYPDTPSLAEDLERCADVVNWSARHAALWWQAHQGGSPNELLAKPAQDHHLTTAETVLVAEDVNPAAAERLT